MVRRVLTIDAMQRGGVSEAEGATAWTCWTCWSTVSRDCGVRHRTREAAVRHSERLGYWYWPAGLRPDDLPPTSRREVEGMETETRYTEWWS